MLGRGGGLQFGCRGSSGSLVSVCQFICSALGRRKDGYRKNASGRCFSVIRLPLQQTVRTAKPRKHGDRWCLPIERLGLEQGRRLCRMSASGQSILTVTLTAGTRAFRDHWQRCLGENGGFAFQPNPTFESCHTQLHLRAVRLHIRLDRRRRAS